MASPRLAVPDTGRQTSALLAAVARTGQNGPERSESWPASGVACHCLDRLRRLVAAATVVRPGFTPFRVILAGPGRACL